MWEVTCLVRKLNVEQCALPNLYADVKELLQERKGAGHPQGRQGMGNSWELDVLASSFLALEEKKNELSRVSFSQKDRGSQLPPTPIG